MACPILSTGELSIREKIEQGGGRAFAGQLVRFPDIPIEGGIIIDSGGVAPGKFAIQLKRACGRYYGTLAPAFLAAIIARFKSTYALSAYVVDQTARYAGPLARMVDEPELKRVAPRFALAGVAGKLAEELGVFPASSEEIRRAIEWAYAAWMSDSATLTDTARGLRSLQGFLRGNPDRFESTIPRGGATPYPVRRRTGFLVRLPCDGSEAFALFDEAFREATGHADTRAIGQELQRLGFLFQNEAPRLKARHDIPQLPGRPRLITVRANFLAWQGPASTAAEMVAESEPDNRDKPPLSDGLSTDSSPTAVPPSARTGRYVPRRKAGETAKGRAR